MQMTVFIFITGNFKYHTEDGLSRKSRRIWVFFFFYFPNNIRDRARNSRDEYGPKEF